MYQNERTSGVFSHRKDFGGLLCLKESPMF